MNSSKISTDSEIESKSINTRTSPPLNESFEQDKTPHQPPSSMLGIQRSQETFSLIQSIQRELNNVHRQLGERFHIDIEEHAHRLTIERDEVLVNWGRQIIGLMAQGVDLKLHLSHNEIYEAYASSLPSYSVSLRSDERVIGDPQWNGRDHAAPIEIQDSEDDREHLITEQLSRATPSANKSMSEDHAKPSIDLEDDDDDPGVADAEPISLTQFSLADLRAQMSQPKGWISEPLNTEKEKDLEWKSQASELSLRLGPPREYTLSQMKQLLIELEAEVECCQKWSPFDREIQNAIITVVTSRLRKVQEELGEDPFDQDRLAKIFRRLTRFSSDFRPGFIFALSREKMPEFESWAIDEQHAWARLEAKLDLKKPLPKLSPQGDKTLKSLKELLKLGASQDGFSQKLRTAVDECLSAGLSQESPHLTTLLGPHLSHLSGKRFKKLRTAANGR